MNEVSLLNAGRGTFAFLQGDMSLGRHLCNWNSCRRLDFAPEHAGCGHLLKHLVSRRQYCIKNTGPSVSCSCSLEKDPDLRGSRGLEGCKVIYSVAPAMGHNQVYLFELLALICTILLKVPF
uniref:Uncharacterized protein n=1 Tax=Rhizophora mucronata TaxID=61149 RepID=A0A2P2KYT8_RHIMU